MLRVLLCVLVPREDVPPQRRLHPPEPALRFSRVPHVYPKDIMLVIRAEIWPYGEVENRFEIARVGIINRNNRSASAIADYNVVSILGRDKTEHVVEGVVLAHFRHNGWQPLAAHALRERGPSIFHPDYTQSIVDLLKRG